MALKIFNKRMIELCENSGMTAKEFYTAIGFNHFNISQIRSGKQSFTLDQMAAAIKKYNIDANYFFKKDYQNVQKKELSTKELATELLRRL